MSGRGRGGKRSGSGRKASGKEPDWNKYKKDAKVRKLEESAKSSMDLKAFFSKKEVNQSAKKQEPDESTFGENIKVENFNTEESLESPLELTKDEKDGEEKVLQVEPNERMNEGEAGEVHMNKDKVKKEEAVVEIDNSSKWEPNKDKDMLNNGEEKVLEVEPNERMKEGEAGKVQINKDEAVIEIDNSSMWEPSKKLPTSDEEVVVDDKKSSYEKKAGLATDIISVEIPSVLPFFVNGCFAPGIDIYFLHEASYI